MNKEKNKLLIILVALMIMVMLCSCNNKEIYNKFIIISKETNFWYGDLYTVYDKDTKVMYFYTYTSYKINICPIYDSNGEVMLYKD